MQLKTTFKRPNSATAFTLIEVLVVVAVFVVLLALMVPAFNSINSGTSVTKAAYDIAGALEMAKTYAIAHSTYVWVGFFEENGVLPSTNPASSGTGRVIISVVAANDGTNELVTQLNNNLSLSSSNASQVYKLIKLQSTHLAPAPGDGADALASFVRTSGTIPAAGYQIGDPGFNPNNTAYFSYPLPADGSIQSGQYQFSKVIQFSPLGDASQFTGSSSASPVPWMEIGIRPTHGNVSNNITNDVAAVELAGIGGQASIQRP